jgi:hypothetical protein
MSKITIKELQPYEILDLFGYVSDQEVELQWKKNDLIKKKRGSNLYLYLGVGRLIGY